VEVQSAGTRRGAEFTVYLPALSSREVNRDREARPAERETHPPVSGEREAHPPVSRRVLIVDDNHDAADALGMALGLEGHSIETAHDGPEALAAAAEFEPDAVVLDIGLPEMDGYEVARRLRGNPRFANLLLLAVSGYGRDDDRRRSREAGFDHHLTKPVSVDELNALIVSQARKDPERPPGR
jgi:CheY-like chemotaxis protein